MSNWVVVLLGFIEGITEFLPISSTGHLLLAEHGLRLNTQPSELFNVVIQCGAVLAVLLAFADRLKKMWADRQNSAVRDYVAKLFVAFVTTAFVGLVLKKLGLKLPETPHPVAWATLIGGVIILVLERMYRRPAGSLPQTHSNDITWTIAIIVGLSQVLAAALPGTSRSGASIMAALAMGLARPAATEFSFLLGVPTLLSAGAYTAFSAYRHAAPIQEPIGQLLLGTAVAAITAFLVVKWLLKYVQSHSFTPFGWYRIALGALILILVR